jgi:hypothetical protein
MFALADEVSLDTEVLARWRQSESVAAGDTLGHDDPGPADPPRVDPLPVDPLIAEVTDLLRPPSGALLPALHELTAPDADHIPDRLVADVLDDALAHLRVRWE